MKEMSKGEPNDIYALNRVAPDTDLAGYPVWPDIRYPVGYPAK